MILTRMVIGLNDAFPSRLFDFMLATHLTDSTNSLCITRNQLKQLEADLWNAADNLRANSDLKSSEYSTPALGLIVLKFADNNYCRKVFDLACPSAGMFVQSAHCIEEHRKELKDSDSGIYVYRQKKTLETVNLAKMNLAVNGPHGRVYTLGLPQ